MDLQIIGYIKSQFKEPLSPELIKEKESCLVVKEDYFDGLDKIEEYDYLQVVFYFHKSEGFTLKGPRRMGKERGVFASRSPRRPSPIGITTVRLVEKQGNKLIVTGLDAIDETPILDIKPYSSFIDDVPIDKRNPRREIETLIEKNELNRLLSKAGELHGHYCPYLSLGVRAAAYGFRELKLKSDGMEEILAIVETNSCFSDGIQYVSGCTFGNNGLIYRDYGKTAVTLVDRNGKGIRIYVKERENFIKKNYPEASQLFQKVIMERNGTIEEKKEIKKRWSQISFDLLTKQIDELFDIQYDVCIDIPDYAPIFEDEYCTSCGEKIMAPKAAHKNSQILCISCSDSSYFQLDGSGLSFVNKA